MAHSTPPAKNKSLENEGETLPDWAQEYDDPVVERVTGGSKRMHAVDLEAEEPRPRCETGQRVTVDWIVRERAPVEGWHDLCGCPACQEHLTEDNE